MEEKPTECAPTRVDILGVKVSATTSETSSENVTVSAWSPNSCPATPSTKTMGTKTQIVVRVLAVTAEADRPDSVSDKLTGQGIYLVNMVHDELILEVEEGQVQHVRDQLVFIMSDVFMQVFRRFPAAKDCPSRAKRPRGRWRWTTGWPRPTPRWPPY